MDFIELMESLGELGETIQALQGVLTIVGVVVGGLLCFFGYKLFRAMAAIIGFIVGGVIGAIIGGLTAGEGGAFAGLLILGILGALLAYTLYRLGVFILCFGGGAVIGLALAMLMGDSDAVLPLAAIVGLIAGIIGVILTKPVLIVSTSVGGGMSMGLALGGILENTAAGTVLGVLLAIAGIFVQFYLEKKKTGEEAPTAGGASAANGASAAANKAFSAPRARQPGSPFSFDAAKALTKDDLTSQQAIYGAVAWGALGFGFLGFTLLGIGVTLVLILFGACVGGCANRAGVEHFIFSEDAFKNRMVAIPAAIGGALGLFAAFSVGRFGLGFAWQIWSVIFYLKSGAAIGYLLEMRRRYKAAYGSAAPAASASTSALSGPSTAEAPFRAAGSAAAVPSQAAPAASRDALVKNSSLLWAQGLPIIVTETSIVPRPEDPALVSLSLAFQNLSGQAVIAVYFGVRCFNLLNQELEPLDKLTVQDFTLEPGGFWSCPRPYALPDSDTRRIELAVRHVVMKDGSTWDCEAGQTLTAVEEQPPLGLDSALTCQFFQECSGLTRGCQPKNIFKYQPQEAERHWRCACGQINLTDRCLACGINRQILFERVNREYLEERSRLRMAEQARLMEEQRREAEERRQAEERLRAERQRKIEAQKQAALEKATKVKDWAKKKWTEKIWPHRKKIAIALCAAVVIAIGASVARQYQIQAEAERLRVEQELEAQRRAEEQAEAERRRAEAEAERRKAEEEAQRQAARQAEFDQIIADVQSRSYAAEDTSHDGYPDRASGTCYIEYMDFNGDGQEELVVGNVSNSGWVEFGSSTAEFRLAVYGGTPYEVAAWDETMYELGEDMEEQVISLVKCGGEVYIKIYEVEGDRTSGAYTERSIYQAFDAEYALTHVETQETIHTADGAVTRRSDPEGGTANVYTDEVTLVTLSQSSDRKKAVVGSWGMLPEIPEAMQWMPSRVYVTQYAKVNEADFPAFCFICPEGWTVTAESVNQSSEIVTLENGRGAKVTFSHSLDASSGGEGIFTEDVEVSKAAASSFGSGCGLPKVDEGNGTYSIRSFEHGLGPFMVARISRAEDSAGDGAALAYAVLPETEIGTHEAPYSASFSLSSYGARSIGDVTEQDYGSVSIIAEGSLTGQDEADVVRMLASFCSYIDAL